MFKKLIDALAAAPAAPDKPEITPELALGALLVHAARSDGDYAASEKGAIDAILADAFDRSAEGAAHLRAEAETADAQAADLVRFTRVLKDNLSEAEREQALERMWRVVLTDGVRDVQEDVFMRRVAGLLYVSDVQSNTARRRAMGDADPGAL